MAHCYADGGSLDSRVRFTQEGVTCEHHRDAHAGGSDASAQAPGCKGYVAFGAGIGNYPDLCSSDSGGLDCTTRVRLKFFAGYMFCRTSVSKVATTTSVPQHAGCALNPPAGTIPLPSNADVYTQIWSLRWSAHSNRPGRVMGRSATSDDVEDQRPGAGAGSADRRDHQTMTQFETANQWPDDLRAGVSWLLA